MNLSKTLKPFFSVEVIKPTAEELKSYYEDTGEIKLSSSAQNSPREFKKAKILSTYNEKKYPVGSIWMMGESPGLKINFFGDKIIMIQKKDLYARIS